MPTETGTLLPPRTGRGRHRIGWSCDLLFVGDLVCVCVAAATVLAPWPLRPGVRWDGGAATVLVVAVVGAFILRDVDFEWLALRHRWRRLVLSHLLRLGGLAIMGVALDMVSPVLYALPSGAVLVWLTGVLLCTSLTRCLLVAILRQLQRAGRLCERVALVGAGPAADRLLGKLVGTDDKLVQVMGIFDDRSTERSGGARRPAGTLAQLIVLGQTIRLDRIVLVLPADASQRVLAILTSLKALSVPVSLCPLGKHGESLSDCAAESGPGRATASRGAAALEFLFDDFTLDRFVAVADRFGQSEYGFVVTPNADHLIRLHDDPAYRALYGHARFILQDSRFLSHLLRLTRGIRLPVCLGSDLLGRLFADVIRVDDRVVLIGGTPSQLRVLRERYGLAGLAQFVPPMGFIHNPAAVEECLRFIEAHSPFRFCLLAVGAPQQEMLARQLQARGVARGLALCIGAAVNFLTGDERRAPAWMRACGSEWLFRLLQDPRRLARRYLVRGPRVFRVLWAATLVVRQNPEQQGAESNPSAGGLPAVPTGRPVRQGGRIGAA